MLFSLSALPVRSAERMVRLPLRSRVELFKGSGAWREARIEQEFAVERTGVLICDMWNKHRCSGATRRVAALAAKMEPFLRDCRKAGMLIIHSPSEVMDFYKETPQRRRAMHDPR